MYNIGVYQICKNENSTISRWYNCVKDEQDGIFVTDTGSTDGTYEKFLELQLTDKKLHVQQILVTPWRFDVQRNISLDFVPQTYDIMLCLDLDETISKGWRLEIEKQWEPELCELFYPYISSWIDDQCTVPKISMYNFKIHTRYNCEWSQPVHEIIRFNDERPSKNPQSSYTTHKSKWIDSIKSYHYQSKVNDRSVYLQLLKLAITEQPENTRNYYLLQREYLNMNNWEDCIQASVNYLEKSYNLKKLSGTDERQIRQLVMQYIQESIKIINIKNNVEDTREQAHWLLKQVAEDPDRRENWVFLSEQYSWTYDYPLMYQCQVKQISITNKLLSGEILDNLWGDYPQSLQDFQQKKLLISELSKNLSLQDLGT